MAPLGIGHDEIGDADKVDYVLPNDASDMLESRGFPKFGPVALILLYYQVAQKIGFGCLICSTGNSKMRVWRKL